MNSSDKDSLVRETVSRETFERLEVFESLLLKWNQSINLVSRNSLDSFWVRHIADSIQVFRLAGVASKWLDIGSGGGLPGAIVGILAKEESPALHVTLIESDKRKAAFLRTVARETGANFSVIAQRIEVAVPQKADIISARAVAKLSTLLTFAERHLDPKGVALFSKGISWKKELDEALLEWDMDVEPAPSLTEVGAVILKIKGISRA